jgi:hypothetical protein
VQSFWERRPHGSGSDAPAPPGVLRPEQAVFSLLGDVTEGALPVGWTDEQIVVLIGDVRLNLRTRPPGEAAILRVFHLVGDVQLHVSPGTRVTTSGTTLLGDQRVDVEPGEGPEVELRAWGLLGDVKVHD